MHIRKIMSEDDIADIVDIHIDVSPDIPFNLSRGLAIARVTRSAGDQGTFFRAIEEDGEVVGCILARPHMEVYSNDKIMNQNYCSSKFTGLKAASAIRLAHRAWEEYATKCKYDCLMSCRSFADTRGVFNRILEKDGWETHGYISIKRLR